jgi:hypothetical protein
MPEHAIDITNIYEAQLDFFSYCFKESKDEFRQVDYDPNDYLKGAFSMRLFWIDEESGLGYGIANDWKLKQIKIFRFGSDEQWARFKCGFAAQFVGDNS